METQQQQIRDQQKESWNKFSPGWKKWNDINMELLKPMGDEIIKKLHLKDSDNVLDIAAGTGEPGLTIAGILKNGRVTSTDLSEGMMQLARENAEKRGLKNFTTSVCDVCELPFPDNSFDAVSCRMGFMFFPDILLAAKEMYRVLKPGGRMATAVWDGPQKNFWVTAITAAIGKNMEMPSPPPGSPGMFRCSESGMMESLLQQAGFKNISRNEVQSTLAAGTIDAYWEMMTEVAAPVVSALSKADDATNKKIKEDLYSAVREKYPDGNIQMDTGAIILYAEK
jgi:ubiquinone/menaquinone biosynthesis C-methylase UbiE